MHALDALVGPVGVLVGRADEQDVGAGGVGAVARRRSPAGETTLPLDLDIFAPSLVIIPCVNSRANGSWTSRWPEVGERLA